MQTISSQKRVYNISLGQSFFIHDAPDSGHDRLLFHVKSGDYFAVVATVLGFLQESIGDCHETPTAMDQKQLDVVRTMRSELKYLHENYKIVPKQAAEKQISAF